MPAREATDVLAIVGPTGSGKSAAAFRLAEKLGGEIISSDSMMVYRGMDIGTAKPSAEIRKIIPHHMIDVVDPGSDYSVGEYQPQARTCIDDVAARGLLPIIAGGTGLYTSAAVDDLRFPAMSNDASVRERLIAKEEEIGPLLMHKKLMEVDPAAASFIHINNTRRVIRALEVYELTGEKYSTAGLGFKSRHAIYNVLFAGIEYERDELIRRINVRCDRMLLNGWLEEAARLFAPGRTISKTAAKAIGYGELKRHLDGDISLETATELIKTATRRYAKRQMTWFRGDKRVRWFRPTAGLSAKDTADAIELFLKAHNESG